MSTDRGVGRDIVWCGVCSLWALFTLGATPPPRDDANRPAQAAHDAPESARIDWQDIDGSASELRGAIERFETDRASLRRSSPFALSPTRRDRVRQFYHDWQKALRVAPFESMAQDARVDYVLLKNEIDRELHELTIRDENLARIAELIPFAPAIAELVEARRRMEPIDPERAATTLAGLDRQIANTRQAVEKGLKPADKNQEPAKEKPADEAASAGLRVTKTAAIRALRAISDVRRDLGDWYEYYHGYDPLFTWWAEKPYEELTATLQGYETFLREQVVGVKQHDKAIVGTPIGREALLIELAHEMIPYSPDELVAIANQEFAWCEAEMKRASHELGCGDDWKKALELVKRKHVEPGKQPALIRDLALEAIRFLDEHDLVTVPPFAREIWRMEMMSPERQLVNPFFTGGEVISISYPTNTMTHEQKMMTMRGNNIHFSRATVHHEVIPGHHLQAFMLARHRPYRHLFATPFWTEGWALYWEMVLWDMKFPKSPEDRVGMLFWRMHRCARIVFSLSFHLEKMTPQECIDYLVERVGHERDNATGEVRRSFEGGYGPLYQCAYMLGALQFRALRRELVDTGKMTNRAFHDAILREHNIPVEMVRAILTKQELPRDFTTQWKFYGEKPGGN